MTPREFNPHQVDHMDRMFNAVWNVLVVVEIATKLAILAPVGVAVVAIDIAAELRRRWGQRA